MTAERQREPLGRPSVVDVAMRTRAARYYALAMDLHDRGMWAACANARRIACIMWHLADPSLQWPNVVHC